MSNKRKKRSSKESFIPHRVEPDITEQPVINIKEIHPRTEKQRQYLELIYSNDIVLCSGPAGAGKSLLACYAAVKLLLGGSATRIVITRPIVEAGESLGFLPGDIGQKTDPYIRPIYEYLYLILGKRHTTELIEEGIIDIIPLCYMRGLTFDNTIAILDEAQNTSKMQMKMFLTRIGYNSKLIINGDLTQTDLKDKFSGLSDAMRKLVNIEKIASITLGEEDVMRNPIIKRILRAYSDV